MSDVLTQQFDKFLPKQPVLGNGVYLASPAVVPGYVTFGDFSSFG